MAHLLDANCFIEPFLHYYGFDVCPGYWSWIEQQNVAGELFSIDKIKDELTEKGDDLSDWADTKDDTFFLPVDNATLVEYARIITWVNAQNYTNPAKRRFAAGADPFLIAFALAHGHIIVTHETHEPLRRNKVKIPNVCLQFGVNWMMLHDFLKSKGVRFTLV
ncbi:MAG: DUF4411 family protein [Anaerolineae bacterium]